MSHKNGKEYITTQEAYKILADYFQLTNEQRNYLTQSGENDWEARVRSSYNYLKKKGVIESASRGEWALTKKGIELFEEMFPPKIIFRNSI